MSGVLRLTDVKFETCSAAQGGGAVHAGDGIPIYVENSEFLNNTATNWGGALNGRGGVDVRNSIFRNNSAAMEPVIVVQGTAGTGIQDCGGRVLLCAQTGALCRMIARL